MLQSRGWLVEDHANERKAYDLMIQRGSVIFSVEVKRQSAVAKGKICLELEQVGKRGWFYNSGIDKMIFTYDDTFVVINMDDLQEAYKKYQPKIIFTNEGKQICFLDYGLLKQYESYQEIIWHEDWV